LLSIYLCDDEPAWVNILSDYIEKYILEYQADMKIVYASDDPYLLLGYLKSNPPEYGIYFLDVNFNKEIDGLELAKQVRKFDPRGFINIVTVHTEAMVKTFQYAIEAMCFIVKNAIDENLSSTVRKQVFSCLDNALETYNNNISKTTLPTIKIGEKGTDYIINLDDIISIEKCKASHKLNIHLKNSNIQLRDNLDRVRSDLGDGFMLINRSCILNLSKIKEHISPKKLVILENGKTYYLSRTKNIMLKKLL